MRTTPHCPFVTTQDRGRSEITSAPVPGWRQGDETHQTNLGMMFPEVLIHHHTGAIREAEKCLDRAEHEELLTLCEYIIVTQAAEIEEMQTRLCDW